MLIAFCSFKQAPGVTTAALGLARSWSRPVLLADLDPAGGDLSAGLIASEPATGLQDELLALRRVNGPQEAAEHVWRRAGSMTADGRLRLLPGLDDPGQASGLEDGWQVLAGALATVSAPNETADVLADCGRLSADSAAWPVLCAADLVVPVVRSTAAGVRRAAPGLRLLTDRLTGEGSSAQLRLIVRDGGPYTARDIADAFDVPLLAGLPDDPAGAALLTAGSPRRLSRTRLWRQLAATATVLTATRSRPVDLLQPAQGTRAVRQLNRAQPRADTDTHTDIAGRQPVDVA